MPELEKVAEEGRPLYGGKRLPRWALLGLRAQIRYCPECLQEGRYIRARWRLVALTVCPAHGVNLKEGLVEPAITTAYKRASKRLVGEVTAEEAADGASCPTPAALAHVRQIWDGFEDAVRSGAADDEVVRTLAWAILTERLLDLAVTAKRGLDYPTGEVPRHEHRARWVRDKGLSIAPNETSLNRFLSQLPEGAHRRAVLSGLKRMLADEEREPTLLSGLPLAAMRDALLNARPAKEASLAGSLPQAMRPPGFKSLDAVEASVGCSWRFLKYLVDDGWFHRVQQIGFGRKRFTFISDEDVARLHEFMRSTFTLEALLSSSGLTRKDSFLFLQCRPVSSVRVGPWRRYLKSDVEDLVQQFEAVALPVPSPASSWHPLWGAWIHQRGRIPRCAVEVLVDLLKGELPLYKRAGATGMQSFFVDARALDSLRRRSDMYRANSSKGDKFQRQLSLWKSTDDAFAEPCAA